MGNTIKHQPAAPSRRKIYVSFAECGAQSRPQTQQLLDHEFRLMCLQRCYARQVMDEEFRRNHPRDRRRPPSLADKFYEEQQRRFENYRAKCEADARQTKTNPVRELYCRK